LFWLWPQGGAVLPNSLCKGNMASGANGSGMRKAQGQDCAGRGEALPAVMRLVILERGRATA
jgi:hypothetical protein